VRGSGVKLLEARRGEKEGRKEQSPRSRKDGAEGLNYFNTEGCGKKKKDKPNPSPRASVTDFLPLGGGRKGEEKRGESENLPDQPRRGEKRRERGGVGCLCAWKAGKKKWKILLSSSQRRRRGKGEKWGEGK